MDLKSKDLLPNIYERKLRVLSNLKIENHFKPRQKNDEKEKG